MDNMGNNMGGIKFYSRQSVSGNDYNLNESDLAQYEVARIHNGNVVIGITNPSEKLDVAGNIKIRESNGSDNTDPMTLSRLNNGYNSSELRLSLGDDLDVSDDFLSIGVYSAAHSGAWKNFFKLNTRGELITKKVIVTLDGWSDNVFDKNYRLVSLKDVEEYIKENKHLPNIPSEKTIVEKGLDTGEMLKLQMAKIEELTLHLIEQQKQIANQQKELESLKAKLNK
jgi:hypothetical protein